MARRLLENRKDARAPWTCEFTPEGNTAQKALATLDNSLTMQLKIQNYYALMREQAGASEGNSVGRTAAAHARRLAVLRRDEICFLEFLRYGAYHPLSRDPD